MIFISVAEQSADRHAAALIRATTALDPSVRFAGVAGPSMVEAGCQPILDMTAHSAMLLSSVGQAGRAIAMLSTSAAHLRRHPFDAAVLLDSPVLHLPLAKRALSAGVPVLYYIAPQTWAWGASRNLKLRNWVNQLAVILPFEEEYFRNHGICATYVGHPLAEEVAARPIDQGLVDDIRSRGEPIVALLPGSRRHVVREVLRGQLEVANRIRSAIPSASFGISVANPQVEPIIRELSAGSAVAGRVFTEKHEELIEAAQLVLVASGTTTLEVAMRGRPMIVMYNASRAFYHLFGRWVIKTSFLSLPNILAGREVVPEFMPYYRSIDPIAERAVGLLQSEADRRRIAGELKEVVAPLLTGSASQQTARLLLDMIEKSAHKEHR